MARTVRKFAYSSAREREIVKGLQTLANIGPAMADDLLRLGVTAPADLAPLDAGELYERLCTIDGIRHDPCVLDTFMAAIDTARGNPSRPWWTYTPERKRRQSEPETKSEPDTSTRCRTSIGHLAGTMVPLSPVVTGVLGSA